MKEITVISGKGGTGKSSITAALTYLNSSEILLADCDVDAANLHLLFEPDISFAEEFYSGKAFYINHNVCNKCGRCMDVCRFNAITSDDKKYEIDQINCEGCGYCYQVCPEEAIFKKERNSGKFFISKTRLNNYLIHARLNIAAENSGKLVAHIRMKARMVAQKNAVKYILIDGSPGIGCPVIACMTGTNFIVMVTEPTISGFHDMKRVNQLNKRFGIKSGCIINKADINDNINRKIKEYLNDNGIILLDEIPYNDVFSRAIADGKTIMEVEGEEKIKDRIINCWEKIKNAV